VWTVGLSQKYKERGWREEEEEEVEKMDVLLAGEASILTKYEPRLLAPPFSILGDAFPIPDKEDDVTARNFEETFAENGKQGIHHLP